MKVQAVVPAAGTGERLGADTAKPFVLLKKVPLIAYTLKALQDSPEIHSIILAAQRERIPDLEKLCKDYGLTKVCRIVAGGRTRRESVSNALSVVDKDTGCVLIHDAARPLITGELISRGIETCREHKAAVAAVPVISTVKEADPADKTVSGTPDRSRLWEAQTPQVFEKNLIVQAHEKVDDARASDDAVLVERLGHKVKLFQGDYKNIKVTTPDDLRVAEMFLNGPEG